MGKPDTISTREALQLLGDGGFGPPSKSTLIKWIKKHNLGVKLGGRWFIYRDRLERFMTQGNDYVAYPYR